MRRAVNLAQLVAVARALGPPREQVVFVGGSVTELLITDPAYPPLRVTEDVDVTAPLKTLGQYERFAQQLRDAGFREDIRVGAPICRWTKDNLVLDVIRIPLSSAPSGNTPAVAPHRRTRMLFPLASARKSS